MAPQKEGAKFFFGPKLDIVVRLKIGGRTLHSSHAYETLDGIINSKHQQFHPKFLDLEPHLAAKHNNSAATISYNVIVMTSGVRNLSRFPSPELSFQMVA